MSTPLFGPEFQAGFLFGVDLARQEATQLLVKLVGDGLTEIALLAEFSHQLVTKPYPELPKFETE